MNNYNAPVDQLISKLEELLPDLKFEGWYEPNPLNMGRFVIRAIKSDSIPNSALTYDYVIASDSLEPAGDLAETLAPYIERGLHRGGVRRYKIGGLSLDNYSLLQQIVIQSIPSNIWGQWFNNAQWKTKEHYDWREGISGVSNIRLGPLFSVAIGMEKEDKGIGPAVAAFYYESGIVEMYFYPDYDTFYQKGILLEVLNPLQNMKIIRQAVNSISNTSIDASK